MMQRRIIKLSVLITAFFVLWGSLSVQAAQKLVFGFKGISSDHRGKVGGGIRGTVRVDVNRVFSTALVGETGLMFATGTAPT